MGELRIGKTWFVIAIGRNGCECRQPVYILVETHAEKMTPVTHLPESASAYLLITVRSALKIRAAYITLETMLSL